MSFGEKAASRRRLKDLKGELKLLKKDLIEAGCEKNTVINGMKEFQETLELGSTLCMEYETAGEHLRLAREAIETLLECMGESSGEEVKASLLALQKDLELVYHDCSIREDDLDFQSTVQCFRRLVGEYSQGTAGMSAIMLRSELENIKAVLDDASVWDAPDFLALAYFFRHENKNALKEMENGQRNDYVLRYLREHFWDSFLRECGRAGLAAKAEELVQGYLYGENSAKNG